MTYRDIDWPEYETAAHEALSRIGKTEDTVSGRDLPVDPELYLRKHGIKLFPRPGLKRDTGAMAYVGKYNGQLQVFIDDYHYHYCPESSIFSIGEELGHILFHLGNVDQIDSVEEWRAVLDKNRLHHRYIEQQAKTFSSHFILPSFIFTRYVIELIEDKVDSLSRSPFKQPAMMSMNIAEEVCDTIGLSADIINIALQRGPDHPLTKIIKHYPILKN